MNISNILDKHILLFSNSQELDVIRIYFLIVMFIQNDELLLYKPKQQ